MKRTRKIYAIKLATQKVLGVILTRKRRVFVTEIGFVTCVKITTTLLGIYATDAKFNFEIKMITQALRR